MCLESDRPDGQQSAHGFSLIPVSGVGVVVDGEKTGGNGVEGTFNKDMIKDEMTFLDTQRIVKPLSESCKHMCRAQRPMVRVCAYGEVSHSWQLPLSGRETARKKKQSEECARLQMESELWSTWTTIEPFSLANSFLRLV